MSIADLYKQFPDVHPNIVLKTDVLRQGLRISDRAQAAFNQRDDILWRGFHLFSYDSNSHKVYKNKIPMGFHLSDGCPIHLQPSAAALICSAVCRISSIITAPVFYQRRNRMRCSPRA